MGGSSGQIEVWQMNQILVKSSFQAHTFLIYQLKYIPTLNYLISCSVDCSVKIWSTLTWSLIATYSNHTSGVGSLEQIDDQTMASGSFDGTIHIWNVNTTSQIKIIETGSPVYSLSLLSKDLLAAGLENGFIQFLNLTNGDLVKTFSDSSGATINYLTKVNQSLLASAKVNFKIDIWDLNLNVTVMTLKGHTSLINVLKMVHSNILASGSSDSTIKLWDL